MSKDLKLEIGKTYWNYEGQKFTIIGKNAEGFFIDDCFQQYEEDGKTYPHSYPQWELDREVIKLQVGKTYRSVGYVRHGNDSDVKIVGFEEFKGYIDELGEFYTEEGVFINSQYRRAHLTSKLSLHSEIIDEGSQIPPEDMKIEHGKKYFNFVGDTVTAVDPFVPTETVSEKGAGTL